ncbi:lytic transglycosylase domain-containing protein [Alkalicella caledoniensis]|uniref:lytic transglycosylase domain-containing protein n=1 Tax=Alkalicella caledoniensis TaxID=2731377 RepID=UPI001BD18C11|nr:lytic transglycosylase domain-containing protein [Alkalicella caledoniensis]
MRKSYKLVIIVTILTLCIAYLLQNQLLWNKVYPIEYKDVVWENSDKYEVDPYLILALMKVESRFDTDAVSKRGAKGLMQLMPDTALWIAEQNDIEITEFDLYKPEVNIPLAIWYMRQLINQFDDEVVAIAAYNAGRGNVRRWIDEGVWDGTIANSQSIPFGETREYVLRVSIVWKKYHDIYVN